MLFLAFGAAALACSGDGPAPSPLPDSTGGTAGRGHGGGAGEAGAPGDAGATGGPDFPCAVRLAIEAKCQRCHASPPENGAPFPLLTWDDTRAPYGRVVVHEAMLVAVESGFMPLTELDLDPPVEDLTPAEKATLVSWLREGAPPDTSGAACSR